MNVNALGAHIVGNYFIANAGQVGPAFIYFGSGITADFGPDCLITDNVFDTGSGASMGQGTIELPQVYAIAQFSSITLPITPASGLIQSNRIRAGSGSMPYKTDTGATVDAEHATVTDPSVQANYLNARVGAAHFPSGSYIISVDLGDSTFVVSQEATTGGSTIAVSPCPGIVDADGNPFTLPFPSSPMSLLSNRCCYMEWPYQPPF
jgi:hypothetical protein